MFFSIYYYDLFKADLFYCICFYNDIILYWTYWYIINLPKDHKFYEEIDDKNMMSDCLDKLGHNNKKIGEYDIKTEVEKLHFF